MSITYRLKESQKPYRITFDGKTISGADAREKIADQLKCNMYEIALMLNDQEVRNDAVLPTFTSVVVVRLQVDARELQRLNKRTRDGDRKPGGGGAHGGGGGGAGAASGGSSLMGLGGAHETAGMSEEERKLHEMQVRIAEQSGTAAPDEQVPFPARRGRGRGGMQLVTADGEQRKPPPDYICDNCGNSGHFIEHCFLPRGNALRERILGLPVGIAESQLIVVADASEAQYRTRDGKYVKRKVNEVSLGSARTVDDAFTAGTANDDVPPEIVCGKCHRVVKDAVRTPCCDRVICGARCLDAYIDEHGPECPLCSESPIMADEVSPDVATRKLVDAFLAKASAAP